MKVALRDAIWELVGAEAFEKPGAGFRYGAYDRI